jgi:hypothetical protein
MLSICFNSSTDNLLRSVSTAARAAVLATLVVSLAACGVFHHRKPHAGPKVVIELLELAEDGVATTAFPQYWKRNTLVVDMRGAASSGKFLLKPREGRAWPMRVAFRVTPGSIGLTEVRAEQRMLIPVTREGAQPVDIELASSIRQSPVTGPQRRTQLLRKRQVLGIVRTGLD